MLRSSHRYVAEASDSSGRRLGDLTLAPDFGPAAECTHLEGVRRGYLPALLHHGPAVVVPVFEDPPYVANVQIRFDDADPAFEPPFIPWSYFQPWVEDSAGSLVRAGALGRGDSFVYRICAFPDASGSVGPGPDAEPVAMDLERVALAPRIARATPSGSAASVQKDFPVFVHRTVLDEARGLARAARDRETGGILVGHLHRDTDSSEVHLEITAQITAIYARAGPAHLEFTPETWSAVGDALTLRSRGERILGWWHYHPYFCRQCAPARRRHCPFSQPFFSRDDRELHGVVFYGAYNVALLVSDLGQTRLSCDWFGWRHGSIEARDCYLLP